MAEKRKNNKLVLSGGLGSGIVVTWAWNQIFPEAQMPAEVGSAVGAGLMLIASTLNDYMKEALK